MKFNLRIIALLIMVLPGLLQGGTTGKVAGKVVDAKTGEVLIGANIVLMGTNMGAATDAEGAYFIINVPPGTYSIKASLIGYAAITVSDVKVSVDQTTKIDFQLSDATVQIGDIVVTAEKSIVQKDLTSTESKVSSDDISMLPVEDIQSVINLQAGVVDGHFRGGRTGEVKYLIDGVSANDAFSGTPALEAEVNSIEEVQVLTGTFNAEYGEALSGVVNQITKVAGDTYKGGVSAHTGDYVSTRKNLFQNINDVSPKGVYNFQGNLSGPVPGLGKLLKFFVSGRYNYDDGYLYGKRVFNPSDSSNFSDNPDERHIGATGDNAYVPMNYNEKLSLQGKLSIDVGTGGKGIVINSLYSRSEWKDYNHSYKLNPDGDYTKYDRNYLTSLNYTHVLSNSAFIDITGSLFYSLFKQYVYEDPLDPRYVKIERKKDVSGSAFLSGGTENWHFNHETKTYTGKIDFTNQLTSVHQFKTGVEFQYHDMNYKDFQIVMTASNNYKPTLPSAGAFDYNTYQTNPYQIAAFIQDKIELDYLIMNVGVRFDYFEPDGKYLKDPDNIAVLDDMKPPFPDSLFGNASSKYQFSPRIGISYPMSDYGAIHISYGHFFQVPAFEYLYKNPNFRISLTGEDYPSQIGNVIGNADLKPQQTTMYEIGLQQAITEELGVTLTAYQKDIRNLLGVEIHSKLNFRKFSKLINVDYGQVKGITLSFEKRFVNGFGASVDYTYQVAKGNSSDPYDAANKANASPPIEVNKQFVPLNWDRKHSFNFTITSGIPGNFIASCVGRLGSGLPYTPSVQNERTGLENSDNRPSIFNIDLYLTKYLKVFENQASVFVKVYNLFDTANEEDVFSDTGRAGYTLELERDQTPPRGLNTKAEYFMRPDFYSSPRQIIVGVSYGL